MKSKKRKKSILLAYCIELDEVIDINQAHDAYFSQDEPCKRFNFLCSDERCRELPVPPKITGVSYSLEVFKRPPHFRINEKYEHSPDCIWGYYNRVLDRMLKNKAKYRESSDKNIFKDFSNDIDSCEVFDELFVPGPKKQTMKSKNQGLKRTKISIENQILNSQKRTQRFAALVDLFRQMSPEDKKQAKILITGNPFKISYKTAFKYIVYAEERLKWTHIYYGEATVYHHKKDEQGYRIYFRQKCDYINNGNKLTVSTFISDEELETIKHYKNLIKSLEKYSKYQKPKKVCWCYILGLTKLHEDSVIITAISPRYIVIR